MRQVLVKHAKVGPSKIHRFGLIAFESVVAGGVIDESPMLIARRVPRECSSHAWVLPDGRRGFPLGDGVFVNHSATPNAVCRPDLRRKLMRLVALVLILPGDEITVDYNQAEGP